MNAPNHARPMFDRVPPQNIEAERSVLGSILLNPDAVDVAIGILGQPGLEPFYVEAHALVWSAIRKLAEASQPVDPITLMNQLTTDGTLESAGGISYLSEFTDAVPTSANVAWYAEIVKTAALQRRVIVVCSRFAGEAYKAAADPKALIEQAASELDGLSMVRVGHGVGTMPELIPGAIKAIERLSESNGIPGVTTGISRLDRLLGGLQRQDLVILAARPSVGKTAVAINMGLAAARSGKSVMLFSAEMSQEKIVQRMLCAVGRIDMQRISTGFLARQEMAKLKNAADTLAGLPIAIDDTPNLPLSLVRAGLRQHIRRSGPVSLVVIDYLQLLTPPGNFENRNVAVGELSKGVKGIAREFDTAVLCLSQLSREAEKAGGGELSHLRESGAIEQDADVVLMLNREELKDGSRGLCIDVKKQRNGPTDKRVFARFHMGEQRIIGLDDEEREVSAPYKEPVDHIEDTYQEEDDLF